MMTSDQTPPGADADDWQGVESPTTDATNAAADEPACEPWPAEIDGNEPQVRRGRE